MSGPPGDMSLIARVGAQAPGAPPNDLFNVLDSPVINASNQVAISARLRNSDTGIFNNGVWLHEAGNLRLLVLQGPIDFGVEGIRDLLCSNSDLLCNLEVGMRLVGTGNEDGRNSPISDNGQVVFVGLLQDSNKKAILITPEQPSLIRVPDVEGLSQEDAEADIIAAGFIVGIVAFDFNDTVAEGLVLIQDPFNDGCTNFPPGTEINLLISLGPVPVCGDGVVSGDEECDDNNTVDGDGCSSTCVLENPICGDGIISGTESCDDSGESATCDADCSAVACGDNVTNVSAGEQCDDGNTIDGDGCSSTCTIEACGNGVVDAGETCDDSGESATCDADCSVVACGDGMTNATAGEACDDSGESATCDADCSAVACGDNVTNVSAGEQCDDGNTIDGDGCSSTCTIEACGNGVVDAGETCDDSGESATCDADCSVVACGDGMTNATAGEACDDSGESATCDADCSAVACGDNVTNVSAGEQCDDGNTIDGDGCSSSCQDEVPHFDFGSGFKPPVAPSPTANMIKAGQMVPVRWTLLDGQGNFVRDTSVVSSIGFQQVECSSLSPINDPLTEDEISVDRA